MLSDESMIFLGINVISDFTPFNDFATKIIVTRIIFHRNFLCIHIPELILPGLMNDMVTLILIASMALWKISPHVINVSIIRILTARLVAVVCYYVSVHCAGPSEHLGTVGICLKNF